MPGLSITWFLVGAIGCVVALTLGATVWLGVSTAVETTMTLLRERAMGIINEVRRHMRPAALKSPSTADYFASLERMLRSEDVFYLSTAMAVHPHLRLSSFFSPNGNGFFYQYNGRCSVQSWRDDPRLPA